METARILIVDDDPNICELLKVYLEEEFTIKAVGDGSELNDILNSYNPHLILLDVMLPGKSGFDICKEIRNHTNTPIIFISAKGEEIDKVLGLEFGGDDYITKPFSPREVMARVKAVLRRVNKDDEAESEELSFPGLTINTAKHTVHVNGQYVDLTVKEFEIISLMAQHPNQVFTREQLLDKVWGYDYVGETRAVDSQIKRIRHKFEKIPEAPDYIHTVWGLGYKFEVHQK